MRQSLFGQQLFCIDSWPQINQLRMSTIPANLLEFEMSPGNTENLPCTLIDAPGKFLQLAISVTSNVIFVRQVHFLLHGR